MSEMFCFQCEQTAGGKGCTRAGVCGKTAETAKEQDKLTSALIGLARAADGKQIDKEVNELIINGLFTTITNVNFDATRIAELTELIDKTKIKLGNADNYPVEELWTGNDDIRSLRSTLLLGMRVWQLMPSMHMSSERKVKKSMHGLLKA
jgi:hydroxylamine reductase